MIVALKAEQATNIWPRRCMSLENFDGSIRCARPPGTRQIFCAIRQGEDSRFLFLLLDAPIEMSLDSEIDR